ncbi:ABC transporter ATP-binding protein [Candidatus Contubernalis alkaliaceticus]|uniref:ABC transporter ATP-binding protein n=1 Tax=Candidatus Contubernalis alkaliaceticus TaxID=338645 RepID=UPI001F4C26FE|nr:ATP-binding cassette domain-containing protein [Candidatus Contubernalis alkalaceticus]UNC93018.1 ATP-binding cassette domain-containing protein [Candidatus Contubernalis alkalaceticus]
MNVVKAENLTKYYGNDKAVDSINFQVHKGECFGLLGPNGAGKTTVVKMMYCFSPVTSGILQILGMNVMKNPIEIKKITGVVAQENNLDPELHVLENMIVYASYFNIKRKIAESRARELLEFMDLSSKINTPVENLSGGMRRRLAIARSLINQPQLLVLDEPTTGLDPHARHLVWEQLQKLKKDGLTIILTTHYLEEASVLCDRLIIMDQGVIIEKGAPRELILKHVGKEVVEIELAENLQEKSSYLVSEFREHVRGYHLERGTLYLFTNKGQELLSKISHLNITTGYRLLRPATLEDVFLILTGRKLKNES